MADDLQPTETTAAPETTAPEPAAPATPEPSTPAASPSFGENLRAAVSPEGATPPAALSQADIDARIEAAKAEARKEFAWVGDINPDRLTQLQQYEVEIQNARQDPMGTVQQLIALSLAAGGEHRKKALSFASQLLRQGGAGQPAPQPTADAEPGPDVHTVNEAGQRIELYSAAQLAKWNQWNQRQLEAKFNDRFRPIEDANKTAAERQAQEEQQRQLETRAHATFAKMSKKPGFLENQPEINRIFGERFKATPGNQDLDPAVVIDMLQDAYEAVVFPKFQSASAAATAADASRRAAANTGRVVSPQPTQASPSAPVSFSARLAAAMAKQKVG